MTRRYHVQGRTYLATRTDSSRVEISTRRADLTWGPAATCTLGPDGTWHMHREHRDTPGILALYVARDFAATEEAA